MRKVLWSTGLFCMVLLINSASASVPRNGAGDSGSAWGATDRVHLTDSFSDLAVLPVYSMVFSDRSADEFGNANKNAYDYKDGARDSSKYGSRDRDKDGNAETNKDDHDRGPAPNPEPSTVLLLGAALLMTGAILRRRQRACQK